MLKKNFSNIILIFLVIIFNVLFVAGVSSLSEVFSLEQGDSRGIVLGASVSGSELISLSIPTGSLASLPESQARVLVPEKKENYSEYNLEAERGIAFDCRTGKILFEKNASEKAPIASITKLITAFVFLDHNPGWETIYEIKREDIVSGGKIYLSAGDKVRLKDLFFLSLVGSANTATMALVHSTGLSEEEFVKVMNKKMNELGLESTNFEDPIGLSPYNTSNAFEIAQFSNIAFNNETIKRASLTSHYEFMTLSNKFISVDNTDSLLNTFPQKNISLLGGKTGYTKAAGYCFVGKFTNNDKYEIVSVVLGGDYPNSRFIETKELVGWIYENYTW